MRAPNLRGRVRRARKAPTWRPDARSALGGAAAGASIAYVLGSRRGRARRRAPSSQAAAARRARRKLARVLHRRSAFVRGRARGFVHRLRPSPASDLDDATLVDKIESVVFRDPRIPKGRININAEQGSVFLRGQLESAELIEHLEQAVRAVSGVRAVQSLLHLPGTDAPHPHSGAPAGT